MATLVQGLRQWLTEIEIYYVDFSPDIPDGVTVSSVAATHMPPSGTASTPVVAVTGTQAAVKLGPLSVKGDHYLTVQATLSSGAKIEMKLKINVRL